MRQKLKNLTQAQTIALGFFIVILMGTLLLMLPISSKNGQSIGFIPALFTSASASCVTGLVVVDTYTHWSTFGQIVIITLIQIGGLGFITLGVLFSLLLNRNINLKQRTLIRESVNSIHIGGVVKLVKKIIIGTFAIELIGAVIMSFFFIPELGFTRGVYYSVFHSISAFCNAGFDLMGVKEQFSSLTSYVNQPVVNLVIALLIITGGIGFLTWDDIKVHKHHFHKYRMQSKTILMVTSVLIVLPALYFFFVEFSRDVWGDLSGGERAIRSFFQSVTPRTAGFNTVDLTLLTEPGQMITILLMLIGGSPGSTAGGLKTTTIAVLFASAFAVFTQKPDGHLFRRRIPDNTIHYAATILLMYIVLFLSGGLIISCAEGIPVLPALFEAASAIGTVGLTLGITPELGVISRIVLICLMFFGRVGGLTLVFAAISNKHHAASRLPQEKITVG